MRLWAVVPAAGSGRRFGGERPKQYADLAGKPLIQWTLERLTAHPQVAGAVVVLAPDDPWWPGWSELHGKPLLRADGGAERADSVLAGLRALPASVGEAEFVLVHDAARPCLRAEDLSRLIAAADAGDGALLAAPVRDTLKRADGLATLPQVAATVARTSLWRAFTPQMFRRGALTQAISAWPASGPGPTDEAQAMEATGIRPLLIEGADDNLKVTTAHDLALAAFWLQQESR